MKDSVFSMIRQVLTDSQEKTAAAKATQNPGVEKTAAAKPQGEYTPILFHKIADACDFLANNLHEVVDSRSPQEKLAELASIQANLRKMAFEVGNNPAPDISQNPDNADKGPHQTQEAESSSIPPTSPPLEGGEPNPGGPNTAMKAEPAMTTGEGVMDAGESGSAMGAHQVPTSTSPGEKPTPTSAANAMETNLEMMMPSQPEDLLKQNSAIIKMARAGKIRPETALAMIEKRASLQKQALLNLGTLSGAMEAPEGKGWSGAGYGTLGGMLGGSVGGLAGLAGGATLGAGLGAMGRAAGPGALVGGGLGALAGTGLGQWLGGQRMAKEFLKKKALEKEVEASAKSASALGFTKSLARRSPEELKHMAKKLKSTISTAEAQNLSARQLKDVPKHAKKVEEWTRKSQRAFPAREHLPAVESASRHAEAAGSLKKASARIKTAMQRLPRGSAILGKAAEAVNWLEKGAASNTPPDTFLAFMRLRGDDTVIKIAEDAIYPAQISAGTTPELQQVPGVPSALNQGSEAGELTPRETAPNTGEGAGRELLSSNEAAINATKGKAKGQNKPPLAEVLTEPALSAAHDKVLQESLDNTSSAGVKISAAKEALRKFAELSTANARMVAALAKLAEEGELPPGALPPEAAAGVVPPEAAAGGIPPEAGAEGLPPELGAGGEAPSEEALEAAHAGVTPEELEMAELLLAAQEEESAAADQEAAAAEQAAMPQEAIPAAPPGMAAPVGAGMNEKAGMNGQVGAGPEMSQMGSGGGY